MQFLAIVGALVLIALLAAGVWWTLNNISVGKQDKQEHNDE